MNIHIHSGERLDVTVPNNNHAGMAIYAESTPPRTNGTVCEISFENGQISKIYVLDGNKHWVTAFDMAAETKCQDHWHCDPKLASHACEKPNRHFACPSCFARPR